MSQASDDAPAFFAVMGNQIDLGDSAVKLPKTSSTIGLSKVLDVMNSVKCQVDLQRSGARRTGGCHISKLPRKKGPTSSRLSLI